MAYRRQQRIQLTKSKIRQFKQKADELIDIRNTLLRADDEYESIILVQSLILSNLTHAQQLDSENEHLRMEVEKETYYLDLYKSQKRENEINKAFDSDSDIQSTNIRLNSFARILLKAKKTGAVSAAKCADIARHMQKLRLDIEVESHLKQARSFLANDDRVLAQSHLKQAKEALRTSPLEFPEKNQRIKDIAEEIKSVMRSVIGSTNEEETESDSNGSPDASPRQKAQPAPIDQDPTAKKKF